LMAVEQKPVTLIDNKLQTSSLKISALASFCSTAINWLTILATSIDDPLLPVELVELVDDMATMKF